MKCINRIREQRSRKAWYKTQAEAQILQISANRALLEIRDLEKTSTLTKREKVNMSILSGIVNGSGYKDDITAANWYTDQVLA